MLELCNSPPADFSTYSFTAFHANVVESASTYELEGVIESSNAICADQMSRKELKTAIVSRAFVFDPLCRITLALLDLLQSAHGSVQSMPVVPSELGVGALERWVTVRLRLLDTVPVVLLRLVVLGRVL